MPARLLIIGMGRAPLLQKVVHHDSSMLLIEKLASCQLKKPPELETLERGGESETINMSSMSIYFNKGDGESWIAKISWFASNNI